MTSPRTGQGRNFAILGAISLALTGGLVALPVRADTSHPRSVTICEPAVSATINVLHGPWGITFHPDEQRAFVAHPWISAVLAIDTESNTTLPGVVAFGDPGARQIAFSPSGDVGYVSNSLYSSLSRFDPALPSEIPGPIAVGGDPYAVVVNPDGSLVYSANVSSNTLSVVDSASLAVVVTIAVGAFPYDMVMNSDGDELYVANFHDDTLSVVDTMTGLVTTTITGFLGPVGVALSPDGEFLYVTNYYANTVSVVDTSTHTIDGGPITVGNDPHGIAVSPDGAFVIVTNQGDDTISIIDTSTNLVTWTVSVGDQPFDLAISPDGERAYVTNYGSDTVSAIDMNCRLRKPRNNRLVTFDSAGGECSGHPATWHVRFRGSYQLPTSAECHRDGYAFLGWTRDPALTGPDDILTASVSGSADLTAVWAALPPAPTIIGVLANFLCFADCDSVLLAWSSSVSSDDTSTVYLDNSATECFSSGRSEAAEWCWISGLTPGTSHSIGVGWQNAHGAGPRSSVDFSLR